MHGPEAPKATAYSHKKEASNPSEIKGHETSVNRIHPIRDLAQYPYLSKVEIDRKRKKYKDLKREKNQYRILNLDLHL